MSDKHLGYLMLGFLLGGLVMLILTLLPILSRRYTVLKLPEGYKRLSCTTNYEQVFVDGELTGESCYGSR